MNNDKKTTQSKDYKRGYDIGVGKGMFFGAMAVVGGFVAAAVVDKLLRG